jgi:hypothetical protein
VSHDASFDLVTEGSAADVATQAVPDLIVLSDNYSVA